VRVNSTFRKGLPALSASDSMRPARVWMGTDGGDVTELNFKGKEFVYNHHLAVPFRPLEPHAKKSIGAVALDGNLIIHGDNLHALKALLPMYAGKVDCVFIDPPYNTGNEGWSYNDNVNSPMIKEWLSANPVGVEDGLRHDKWCAMMWPRLRLLYELLSEHGSLWMTLDDNEVHRARSMLDEIFGAECCIGQIAWQKRTSRENRATLSPSIDHILVYSKPLPETWKLRRNLLLPTDDGYSNPDKDPRGVWASIPFSAQGFREKQVYPRLEETASDRRARTRVLHPDRCSVRRSPWSEMARVRFRQENLDCPG
jgi:adenine-specific DNA-methyltransferase